MNREQLIAAMEKLLATAEAEQRDLTAAEQSEFEGLKAKIDATDKNESRRADLAAVRQQHGLADRIERAALAPSQSLAALHPRPAGSTVRIGDFIKSQMGLGGAPGVHASQTMNTGGQGGFTVPGYLSAEILDLARAKSRVIQAGARTLPIQGATSFATVESDPTITKGHVENASITESEIAFGSREFRPLTYVALIRASVELIEDSANFNGLVESVLAASFGAEIDRLALYGNGIGQQLGIVNQDGIHEIGAGAFNTWGPFSRAVQAVSASNYTAGAFIVSPAVLGAIDGLVDTTGQPLARPPSLASAAFLDTTSIPAGDTSPASSLAVTGQWDQAFICTRTPLTIEATRTGGDAFNKLSVLIRCYSRLDSFAVRKEAFAKVTSIPVPAIG